MRKRTLIITGASIAALLLIVGGATIAYVSLSGMSGDGTENQSTQLLNMEASDDSSRSSLGSSDTVNHGADDTEKSANMEDDAPSGSNGSSMQTSSIVSDDVIDGMDVLERLSSDDDEDAILDVLNYTDIDYVMSESPDTENILYWLYQVTQGDLEGYIAANDIAIFNLTSESGNYERIEGDITPAVAGQSVRSIKIDKLVDRKTGKDAVELRYTIEHDPDTGKLRSVVTSYDSFDVESNIDEMYPDDDTDDGIDDNAAPIQAMPPSD